MIMNGDKRREKREKEFDGKRMGKSPV